MQKTIEAARRTSGTFTYDEEFPRNPACAETRRAVFNLLISEPVGLRKARA